MKEEDHVERLFASARRAEEGTAPSSVPSGFAESVLRQHRNRVQENKAFLRTSILSVATALINAMGLLYFLYRNRKTASLLGLVATWIPAQRALSVDPLILLREE